MDVLVRRLFLSAVLVGGCFVPPSAVAAQANDFCAYYTRVASNEEFEKFSRTGDFADVVVRLASPTGKLVFWRGASYLPCWETAQGKWYLDEIIPRHGDGPERRVDRVNAFSHVAIVENAPQRVLICWRYLPQFEAGNPPGGLGPTRFAEECFTITPDGRIKVDCNGVAQEDHQTVEAFLRDVAALAGGTRKRTVKLGVSMRDALRAHTQDGHTHAH